MERGRGRGVKGKRLKNSEQSLYKKAEASLLKEHEKVRESLKKFESVDSSSDEDDAESGKIMNNIIERYSQVGGASLGRTQEFLLNFFQSSSNACLICISTIKRSDAIWNCVECYGCFHISCVQKWSRDSLFQLKQAMEDLPAFKRVTKYTWGCPKCRKGYEESDVPHRYQCFCLKVDDPVHHPWLAPHSCGDVCDKPLQPDCGHKCLLLCHPGPCPPCPKTIRTPCYCGKANPAMMRCSEKEWSCHQVCKKKLACNKHLCRTKCHPGECPSCPEESEQSCDCGRKQMKRPCAEPKWKCGQVCGKQYSCGNHRCEGICHPGECGDCPLTLRRTCPCGKTSAVVPCTQDIPTCNDTCGKLMECGTHRCQLKCHKDKCACLEIVRKKCRCGLHQKELPCGKEYTCETKCKRTKTCKKHPCNRKCCDGECPPCEKMCGKTLGCGTHKCQSLCHLGACYPCMQKSLVKCHCGQTVKSTPCGSKRKCAPPRCKHPCRIPSDCHHATREHHYCHFGECPPCKQICNQPLSCGHVCASQCHDVIWQQMKYETLQWNVPQPEFVKTRLPCPPCQVPMSITCWGGHETWSIPCHQPPSYSCYKICNKPLQCTNHVCQMECHPDECEPCESVCVRPRPAGCPHPCNRPCHANSCQTPCTVEMKTKCHCGISDMYIPCHVYVKTQRGDCVDALSCGSICLKNYACGHKCKAKCHPGDCPDPEGCRKRVKMSCPCSRLKKEFTCDVVRRGKATVACDNVCEAAKEEKIKAKELEKAKKQEEAERKNREELEKFEMKLYGKKKVRDRRRDKDVVLEPSFFVKYRLYLLAFAVLITSSIIYYFMYQD